MAINPYESPPSTSADVAASDDLLRFPAYGFIIHSLVMLLLAIGMAAMVAWLTWRFKDLPDHEVVRDARAQLPVAALFVLYAMLGFWCARCMLRRRWRWYVIGYSLVTFLPFTGCLASPLGFLTLFRLWRTDVWNSFSHSEELTQ